MPITGLYVLHILQVLVSRCDSDLRASIAKGIVRDGDSKNTDPDEMETVVNGILNRQLYHLVACR